MKHEYKTTRIWLDTLRNLKRITAETGESIVALIDRLAAEELRKVKVANVAANVAKSDQEGCHPSS